MGALAAAAMLLAACGGDDGGGATPSPTETTESSGATETSTTDGATTTEGSGPAPAELTPEVVIAICCDPAPIDPVQLVVPGDRMVASAVFEPLVEFSEDGELVPGLALSWESDDAQTWIVELRQGVEFSDGEPFNADAVVANYERSKDPEINARTADVSVLDTVTAVDEYTVEFVMTQRLASFPAFLNDVFSNMVSPAVLDGDVAANPVGTGPFIFESRGADQITFTRNPNYWNEGLPRAERLVFRIIPDVQSQLAALQAGDIDVMPNTIDSTNAQAANIDGLEVVTTAGIGTMHIFLNAQEAPFDDVRARMALAHATDREAYVQFTNSTGEGEIVDGPFPSGMPVSGSPRAENWPEYDPDRARELLDEIGGLSFTMLTYNVGAYPIQAQLLQDMWSQVGIEMEINLQDAQTVVADAASRNMTALLSAWSGRPDPDLNAFRYLHSEATTSPSGIQDEVLDDLLIRARETPDVDERRALYQQLIDRIAEIVPIIYLEGLPKSTIIRDDVGGLYMPPDGNVRPQYLYLDS
jgi:peptide/nickel transport system substrate-binding protein